MTLMCVVVSCHDLLAHAFGLIVNHHLVFLWSHEGGVVHLRGKLSVGCSCFRLKFFVCVADNDIVLSQTGIRDPVWIAPELKAGRSGIPGPCWLSGSSVCGGLQTE